jgi:Uma2 family endonuclease
MRMLLTEEKIYTVEEYFDLENQSEEKHEFVNGNLILMTGESKKANKIATNCVFSLRDLRKKGFEIFTHDVRLMIGLGMIFRYPDLVIAPESDDADDYAVTQPILIIEVLSESTQHTDRNQKLKEYCGIESLQYYLLIAQDEISVEMYAKEGNQWIYSFFTKLEDNLQLNFFAVSLGLNVIYEGIK